MFSRFSQPDSVRPLHAQRFLDSFDATDRPVLAIGTDYPPGTLLHTHSHRRAQFLYGATGVMEVGTDDGAWVVPPQRGVWIPAGKPHRVRMLGVSTRSLYIEPRAVRRARATSARC
jgi:quercetin dioxygenase-like cupin family protein